MNVRFYLLLIAIFCVTITQAQKVRPGLKFIANKGQWNKQVKYRADVPGGKLFAEQNSFTYLFYDTKVLASLHDHHHGDAPEHPTENNSRITPEEKIMIGMHAFRMRPLGALSTAIIQPSKTGKEVYNYYLGNDPSRWASGVKGSEEIMYKGIYPGTDLRLYQSGESLKYEFILQPGANPELIRLKYEGLKNIYLSEGRLIMETSVNSITESAPYVYQNINGKEIKIKSRFRLKDSTVTFELQQSYNHAYPLVIDPQLIFSTYSGSFADNWGNTATNDTLGNMYSGGTVFDVGFPVTVGAFRVNYAGIPPFPYPIPPDMEDTIILNVGIDVGILKFTPDGTSLLYATYLGGNFTDVPYSLVVNKNDELVIMGTTSSTNFPTTTGAFDRTFNGGIRSQAVDGIIFWNGSDIFVSRLSSNGSALMASTYIGGNRNDGVQATTDTLTCNYGDELRGDVITDDQNNIYVACNTSSFNFPVTAGAFQMTNRGGKDACVFKLNNNMTTLMWSTYLGGTAEDAAYSIQVDSIYNVYVSGGTSSAGFPVTTGAYQITNLGSIDAFVSHISNNGQLLLHSTFTGTGQYDQAYFVQLDASQNVYLFGQTSGNYPVSASGVYTNINSGHFIHAFTPELDSTLFSTVIGKGGNQPSISPTAFMVNECGNIFLSGWGGYLNSSAGYVGGTTDGLPITTDALRSTSDGSDFYIMVLSNNAASLLYATYFGMNDPNTPDHVDGGTSRFDKKGIIYEAVCGGCGNNDNFPTTPGAWSKTNNSDNCNNAAFKLDLTKLESAFTANRGDSCGRATVILNNSSIGGKTFFWDFGDGHTSTAMSPTSHSYNAAGTYTITLIVTDITTCIGKDTSSLDVFVPPIPPISFNVKDTTICEGTSVQLLATYDPSYTYTWTPAGTLNANNIHNPVATPITTTTYHVVVRDTNQCKVERNIRVAHFPPLNLDIGPDQLICANASTKLQATGNGTVVWEISPYLSCSICREPTLTPPTVSDDYYTAEITSRHGCIKRDSVRVRTKPLPVITLDFNWIGRCYSEHVLFKPDIHYSDSLCPVKNGHFHWDFGDGNTSNEHSPRHNYASPGNYIVTAQYSYSNIAKDTIMLLDKDSCLKNVFIPNTFTPNGDGTNDFVFLRTINAKKILLRIYNRWGEEVFKTEDLHEGWDGTYKGVKQTPQTFVYFAEVTFWDDTMKTLRGNITLVE